MDIDKSKYKNNSKGLLFYKSFLLAKWANNGNRIKRLVLSPIWVSYRIVFNWILGIDINEKTEIGRNLQVWHGIGLIVHPASKIGDNVILRHNTTIGTNSSTGNAPIIGNNVEVGTGALIIGDIKIGDNVIIGAGSVVTKDIPANSIVVGNPAKIIKTI